MTEIWGKKGKKGNFVDLENSKQEARINFARTIYVKKPTICSKTVGDELLGKWRRKRSRASFPLPLPPFHFTLRWLFEVWLIGANNMHSSWEKRKRRKEEEEEEDREAEKPPFVISVVEGRKGKGENRGFRKKWNIFRGSYKRSENAFYAHLELKFKIAPGRNLFHRLRESLP